MLEDAEFDNSRGVRAGLHARGCPSCVQVGPSRGGVAHAPQPSAPRPPRGRGWPRTRPRRAELPAPQVLVALAQVLHARAWRTVTWRPGSTGLFTSCFARFPVWCAPACQQGGPYAPREETCLGEWPLDHAAPTKYWLADLPGEPVRLCRPLVLATGRWRIEQDYWGLKDELGPDHFEGRSWLGWHHRVTIASTAYAVLVPEPARTKRNLRADLAPDRAPAPAAAPPAG